jgi:mannitol 2-dehydrogenase
MSDQARPLTAPTLSDAAKRISVPQYDRGALVPSVVHIGVGGFHRAHQATYFDELASTGETGWGIVGVGLHSREIGEVLDAQDGLYTVVERCPDGDSARVIGVIVDFLYAPDDPAAVVDRLADPRTRLVTLTVTGDGYLVGPDGELDTDDENLRHDLDEPAAPRSLVGLLVEALDRRRREGSGVFTVLSCDNLPDSGTRARTAVTSFARLRDPGLAGWIEEKVSFPDSMVDRITPATSPEVRDELEETLGVSDRWPVIAEPFRHWVVQDDFCNGRPPLDRVGVQFVDDVAPYKTVKTRLLNGGHCALGYLGVLAGHATAAQVMADPLLGKAIDHLLGDEIVPLLPQLPDLDLEDYRRTTVERFGNPTIGDTLARLCRRGSTKVPAYLLPSLLEARASGGQHRLLVVAVGAWLRYLRGTDLRGRDLEIEDERIEQLGALARQGGDDPRPLLGVTEVFGSLGEDEELVSELGDVLESLSERGLAHVVEAALAAEESVRHAF